VNIALLLIGATFVGAIVLGLAASRGRDMKLEQWSVGGRGFGALFIFLLMAGEIYTTFTLLGGSGWAYGKGAPAFYIICYGALAYVMSYWLLPPIWRYATRHRLLSQADFWAHKYRSPGLGGLVALVGVVAMVPYLVLQLKGLGIIVSEASYGSISPTVAALLGTGALVTYVTVSGIHGSALTALVKDVLILVVVVALGLYLPWKLHGGIGEMFTRIEASAPALLTLPDRGLSASWFASTVVLTALGFYLWPHTFGSAFASKSADALRRNATFMPLYQLVLLFVFFTGFAALLAVPGLEGADVDLALLRVVKAALPAWAVGMVGAAGVLTALVPGSMILMAAATLLANTGYRAMHPEASDERIARVAKWCVPAVALVALWFTLRGGATIVALLLMGYAFVTQLFPSLLLSLLDDARVPRVSALAAGTGIVTGVGTVAAMTLSGATVASLAPWLPGTVQDLNVGVVALALNVVALGLVHVVVRAPRLAAQASGLLLVLLVVLLLSPVSGDVALGAQEATRTPVRTPVRVIPQPVTVTVVEGAWLMPRMVTVTTSAPDDRALRDVAAHASIVARDVLGVSSAVGGRARAAGGIHLELDPAVAGAEAYHLTVDARGAEVRASSAAGMFYGVQTLRQLAMDGVRETGRVMRVNAVRIEDSPRFGWRGLHLDMGRHFQPVAFVKRYIDLMALFKLNTFHWHLTEDQGWRIEIKRHPRLTEVGGCRAETMVARNFDPYVGDGIPHCGFYTQDEVRDVVAYAAARHITVVPEIEMPGHAVAALAAYPELACTPGPFAVRTTWGVDENILCPSERTFTVLEEVLTEVMALFPSRFIHIGGDEAPKDRWKASPLAQEVIKREGLKDEHELQSWFIRRVERFLNANGRRLIGWDEILEGGLAPQATVMSWRGTAGGIAAARAGHDVVMTPTDFLYFDYYQGDPRFEPLAIGGNLPLEKVYSYEPVPSQLTADQARHILGAQGNIWTEYLKTPAAVEYHAYPRALALAEITWSPREGRDWEGFLSRLPVALRLLDAHDVNYRLPHVSGLDADVLTLDETARVDLRTPIEGAQVRFTTDGSDPTPTSALYTQPFDITATAAGTRVTARAFTREGKASPPRAATFTRTTYREAERVDPAALAAGLRYEYREGRAARARAVDSLPLTREGVAPGVARRGDERPENYTLLLTGYVRVERDAMYTFALTSDDGSTMSVGDRVIVDNDGFHGAEEKMGMVALRAGLHPLTVRFFQAGGGAALSLRMRSGEGAWVPVQGAMLLHRQGRRE
jgi:hexosaminidase